MREATMSDSIALWHSEHANFAALLDLLEGQLDVFHQGEHPDYEMMLDIMFYMTHYPDVSHHPREDLALARIGELDVGSRTIVDDLTEQHARLKAFGDALARALENVVNGSIASRDQVETPGRAYIAEFRSHMEKEEREILPLATKLLSEWDWAAIGAAVRHIEDPLFGPKVEERYASLRVQIAREARAAQAQSLRDSR
jgi:hemerythrin-like domain-containing protein